MDGQSGNSGHRHPNAMPTVGVLATQAPTTTAQAQVPQLGPLETWQETVAQQRFYRCDPPHLVGLSDRSAHLSWQTTIAHFQAADASNSDIRRAASPELVGLSQRFHALLIETAHDLRAPLATASQAIRSVAEACGQGQRLHAGHGHLLRQADSRLSHALAWMDTILAEHRLLDTERPAIRMRFYPHQLQSALASLLEPIAVQQHVKLQWHGWSRNLPLMYLDAHLVMRCLMNLGLNALQASPAGECVALSVERHPTAAHVLRFSIQDQGPGLPDSQREFLLGNATSLPPAGVGLQLVKQSLAELGACLSVGQGTAGAGCGTRLTLELPSDDLETHLRHWLDASTGHVAGSSQQGPWEVRLFALRSQDSGPSPGWDHRLQAAAHATDFVYRVANHRWLWFSLRPRQTPIASLPASEDDELLRPAFESNRVRQQCVFRSQPFTAAELRASSIPSLPQRCARQLTQHARTLIVNWIAPVDLLAPERSWLTRQTIAHSLTSSFAGTKFATVRGPMQLAGPKFLAPRHRHDKFPDGKLEARLRRVAAMRRDAAMLRRLRKLFDEWGVQSERLCWTMTQAPDNAASAGSTSAYRRHPARA